MRISEYSQREKVKSKRSGEDPRYYFPCPKQKNHAKIPITRCFDCVYAVGKLVGKPSTREVIEIGCELKTLNKAGKSK